MTAAATERVNLLGLPKAELEAFVGELGSKPFRARQIMQWLYKRGEADIAAMTDLAARSSPGAQRSRSPLS
jgi:23S rRNA (adenine2503-C2)-methyltransferase